MILRFASRPYNVWNFLDTVANNMPFEGASGARWLGKQYGDYIDDEGYFLDLDGKRSRVVHQFDRWGLQVVGKFNVHSSFLLFIVRVALHFVSTVLTNVGVPHTLRMLV